MAKDSFILHDKLLDVAFKQLKTDEQLGQLLRAVYSQHKGIDYTPTDPFVSLVLDFFVSQMGIDKERYDAICKKRKEAINKRWSKKNTTDTNVSSTIQTDTNVSYNDNSIDSISTDIESNTDQSNSSPKEKAEKESPLTTAKVGDIIEVKGCKVVKRSQGKIFKIPDIGEIDSYIREKGYHFSAQGFYDYYSSSSPHPWCKANGEPVSSWKQCCSTFESVFLRQEGRRSINNHSPSTEAHADINSRQYEQF